MLRVVREGSASASAAPPPLTVVTQLSIDRLDRLERMCRMWGPRASSGSEGLRGGVVAAILDEDRSEGGNFFKSKGTKSSRQLVSELERRVNELGVSVLKTFLVARSRKNKSALYPINALRNIALSGTCSELVLLVDVDCIPSEDSFDSLCGSLDRLSALRRICINDMTAIVVPCFERVAVTAPAAEQAHLAPSRLSGSDRFSIRDVMEAYLRNDTKRSPTTSEECSKEDAVYRPFMENRFACGHRATDFSRLGEIWRLSVDSTQADIAVRHFYPIVYEEGFEPYVIAARQYVPPYDQMLEGYGRNKALHLYHLHRLGFKYAVSTQACLVHMDHEPTSDRLQFFQGNQEMSIDSGIAMGQSKLMRCVKERYAVARDLISKHCTSWVLDDAENPELMASGCSDGVDNVIPDGKIELAPVGSACVYWPGNASSMGYYASKRKLFSWASHHPEPFNADTGVSDHEVPDADSQLAAFCSIHLRYLCPKLYVERQYACPCCIPDSFIVNGAVFWLVTHLSVDRIDRLRAMCLSWRGPVAAAVWFPPQLSKNERQTGECALRDLVKEAEGRNDMSHLRAVKVDNYFIETAFPFRRAVVNTCVDASTRRRNRHVKPLDPKLSPFSTTMYPVNALRETAIGIVKEWTESGVSATDESNQVATLVIVLDVDMRPPDLLGEALVAQGAASCRLREEIIHRCMTEDKFVVLPALEVLASRAGLSDGHDSCESEPVVRLLKASSVDKLREELGAMHNNDSVRAFHATSFHRGHASSNTNLWLTRLADSNAKYFNTLQHSEGWEPYGIMSLKCLVRAGGYNTCFVGWHRDKIEFIRRIALLGIKFEIASDPRAFVLDWKPHEICQSRSLTTNCRFYRAANEGLYMRTGHQMKSLKELDVDTAWKMATTNDATRSAESLIGAASASRSALKPEPLFSSLRTVIWSSSALSGGTVRSSCPFSESSEAVKVFISPEAKSHIGYDPVEGYLSFPLSVSVLIPPIMGLSFPMKVFPSPSACFRSGSTEAPAILKTATGLGVRYKVRFSSHFEWGTSGGTLPGLELSCFANCPEFETAYFLPSIVARFHWLANGALKLKLSRKGDSKPDLSHFVVGLDNTAQIYRDCWHELSISAWMDGRVFAYIDGYPIYSSFYKFAFEKLCGINMCVISDRDLVPLDESVVHMKDIEIAANVDIVPSYKDVSLRCSHIPSTQLNDDICSLIASDVTVIFAPKETHSLGSKTLKTLLSEFPRIAEVIIVIAPPILDFVAEDLIETARECAHSDCNISFFNADSYQNPYEVRNTIAGVVRTKYILHLNNDVVPAGESSNSWLRSLVCFAERNPQYWAVVPLLFENNRDGRFLHVWWDETCVVSGSHFPKFRARFNNFLTSLPILEVKKHLKHRLQPLLFLEDHAILVRAEHFTPENPLFDPLACYRREFFDIAWGIRSRGGDFGMDLSTSLIYEKVQPLKLCDIPYFVQRRQDELCLMSQVHLNRKWGIDYECDMWQDRQVEQAFKDVNITLCDSLERLTPVEHLELMVSMLVLTGIDRFHLNCPCDLHGSDNAVRQTMNMRELMNYLKGGRCQSSVIYLLTSEKHELVSSLDISHARGLKCLETMRGIGIVQDYRSDTGSIAAPSTQWSFNRSFLFKLAWKCSNADEVVHDSKLWQQFVSKSFPHFAEKEADYFSGKIRPFVLLLNPPCAAAGTELDKNCQFCEAWFWVRQDFEGDSKSTNDVSVWEDDAKETSKLIGMTFGCAEYEKLESFSILERVDQSGSSDCPMYSIVLHVCFAPISLNALREGLFLLTGTKV